MPSPPLSAPAATLTRATALPQAGGGRRLLLGIGLATLAASAVLIGRSIELDTLGATWQRAVRHPAGMGLALGAYALAFILRATTWRATLPQLTFGHALAAIHVSLAGNHLLPLRLGEPLRALSATWRAGIPGPVAASSTLALRAVDTVTVISLAAVLAPGVLGGALGLWGWVLGGLGAVIGGLAWAWLGRQTRHPAPRRPRTLIVAGAGATGAWILESVVVWQTAQWAGLSPSAQDALLVAVVSVAVQILAVTPGGFGTYEAAAVAAWGALGVAPGAAFAAALAAHAVKTAYALVTGMVAAVLPTPSLVGRLRLARPALVPDTAGHVRAATPPAADPSAPVLLFLPAHNEESTVARVLAQAPVAVCDHPVELLVVDDGSRDRTAREAARTGARVHSFDRNLGLGAAVRRGLQEGHRRGAVAVAFCDADGEYDPAELERLVQPILDGSADYVVGSRFAGEIRRMLPHRRLGNRLLTALLAFIARHPVSDGQSGFRALSAAAARDAEIVHDYNYAQVLTLDLLGKGYRYHEVPISYGFREQGRSFVRLGRYLRRVVPAVYRELNTDRSG